MANFPIGQHSFVVFCDGYESEEGMVKLKSSAPSNLQITLSKEAKTALASTMGKRSYKSKFCQFAKCKILWQGCRC